MANSASIEVFGPADAVMRALEAVPGVKGMVVNRVGSTVYDLGDFSAIVGEEYDDTSTLIVVNSFDDPDSCALGLYAQLDDLPYGMEVRDKDYSEVLASRPARAA